MARHPRQVNRFPETAPRVREAREETYSAHLAETPARKKKRRVARLLAAREAAKRRR